MSAGRPNPIFRVMFDDARFADDLAHSDHTGRQIAQAARAQLERDGIQAQLLARCDPEGRDGTHLGGMVKLYLPIPYGDRFGLVLEPGRDADSLYLLAIAFGQRHPPGGPASTTSPTTAATATGLAACANQDSRPHSSDGAGVLDTRGNVCSMTGDGSPYTRFKRALDTGNLNLVRLAAAELPHVAIDDALRVCLLLRDGDPDVYDRAAVRWAGRFALEGRNVRLDDIQAATAALDALPHEPEHAMETLSRLCAEHAVT